MYYVYIVTNKIKTVLYIGVTNHLEQRIIEHYLDRGTKKSFTGKYNCHLLLYYESFIYIDEAIDREKQLKKWSRKKKEDLISSFNPQWLTLNFELFQKWPPEDIYHRRDLDDLGNDSECL